MKYLSLALTALLMVWILSCSKPSVESDPAENPVTVKATEVNLNSLDQDAVEFYKNIAVLAEWYADHPTQLRAELAKNKTAKDTDPAFNDFVGELASMALYDDNNKPVSFFNLDEADRHAFLKDYIKVEAKFLDEKFKLTGTEQIDDHIESVNAAWNKIVKTSAFSEQFNFDAEAAKIAVSNPYETINIDLQQRVGSEAPKAVQKDGPIDEQSFFRSLANLGILNFSPVTFNPICERNTPQIFVDKMRGKLRKGLVLVALPGGYITGSPLAFNGLVFDVGHVAIVSKDASELPTTINKDFKFTIGTNSNDGMHHEEIGSDWTGKHGMSYLMKPIRVSYHYKSILGIAPWYERREEDVDNNKTYQKITEVLTKPYCRVDQMLYAKQSVPDRFICSSSAWWAIKEAHDIGIGNWYKPTIFPAGVYESSDMRVVAQSW